MLPAARLRADLRDFLHRWRCVTYEVNDGAIEVIVPDAPADRAIVFSCSCTPAASGTRFMR